jgi:hypothetical protein
VRQLYEQISKTTNSNLDLTAKLEVAENEIESYKKILNNYQNEISDLKIKFINSETINNKQHQQQPNGGLSALNENEKFKRLMSSAQQLLQNR